MKTSHRARVCPWQGCTVAEASVGGRGTKGPQGGGCTGGQGSRPQPRLAQVPQGREGPPPAGCTSKGSGGPERLFFCNSE